MWQRMQDCAKVGCKGRRSDRVAASRQKGHGLEFGRKKMTSVGSREGFRRSGRLLGSCSSGPSTPILPITHLAASVLGCPDILNQVLALLGPPDLARCAGVCRQWKCEAHAATLWKPLCEVRCEYLNSFEYQVRLCTQGGWLVEAVTLRVATLSSLLAVIAYVKCHSIFAGHPRVTHELQT